LIFWEILEIMREDDKRYTLNSYVDVQGTGMNKIIAMKEDTVTVVRGDGTIEELPWHYIKPVVLTEEIMLSIGFAILKKISNTHHIDLNFNIRLNGRFYNSRGVIYKDDTIWSFYGVSIRYLHQLQQIFWIIEPKYIFNILPTK